MANTWAKLKEGKGWGIRTEGRDGFNEGDSVPVEKKDGRKTSEVLGRCVASGQGWALWECATPKWEKPAPAARTEQAQATNDDTEAAW
jgi:hypothetical protein